MTKMISTVAVIALMGSSTLWAAPPTTDNGGGYDDMKNTWYGEGTLDNLTTGTYNSAFGYMAGNKTEEGVDNVFMGGEAGENNKNGSENIFIGSGAGAVNENGSRNVFIGSDAGNNNKYGSGNVFLGDGAGYNEDGSDELYIANSDTENPLIYGEFDTKYLKVNGVMDINSTGFPGVEGLVIYPALTLLAADIPPSEMAWGIWLETEGDLGGLAIVNTAAEKSPLLIGNDANDSLLGLFKNSVAVNFEGFGEVPEDAPTLIVGGDILATWLGENTLGDGATQLLALDANNTAAGKTSDVGFSIENVVDDFKWTFRTFSPSEGFAASKLGTGGAEFEVGNKGTDLSTTVVKMGGVVVFKNGSLVDGGGVPLASLVQEQNIKLADAMVEMKAKDVQTQVALAAKDAEIIAMKAENTAMKAKQQEQALKIAQLETMQQKVAMMESILTNLALNVSDTDKSKVSINLK